MDTRTLKPVSAHALLTAEARHRATAPFMDHNASRVAADLTTLGENARRAVFQSVLLIGTTSLSRALTLITAVVPTLAIPVAQSSIRGMTGVRLML